MQNALCLHCAMGPRCGLSLPMVERVFARVGLEARLLAAAIVYAQFAQLGG